MHLMDDWSLKKKFSLDKRKINHLRPRLLDSILARDLYFSTSEHLLKMTVYT